MRLLNEFKHQDISNAVETGQPIGQPIGQASQQVPANFANAEGTFGQPQRPSQRANERRQAAAGMEGVD